MIARPRPRIAAPAAVAASLLLCAASALAEQPISIRGDSLGPDGRLGVGPIEVRGDTGATTHSVLVLEAPAVEGPTFALRGIVRTMGVEGAGYLEMWAHFADGSRYFSRTLADTGPSARFSGTAERPFLLPFSVGPNSVNRDAPAPSRLVVNVVLPGPGEVVLGDLQYLARAELSGAAISGGVWWTDREGGWIGALFGTALGIAGAASGLLVSLGRGRRLVMLQLGGAIAIGVAGLLGGTVAALLGQPYAVFYPLLLGGGVALPLGIAGRRMARQRYEADELRRMRAMDLGTVLTHD